MSVQSHGDSTSTAVEVDRRPLSSRWGCPGARAALMVSTLGVVGGCRLAHPASADIPTVSEQLRTCWSCDGSGARSLSRTPHRPSPLPRGRRSPCGRAGDGRASRLEWSRHDSRWHGGSCRPPQCCWCGVCRARDDGAAGLRGDPPTFIWTKQWVPLAHWRAPPVRHDGTARVGALSTKRAAAAPDPVSSTYSGCRGRPPPGGHGRCGGGCGGHQRRPHVGSGRGLEFLHLELSKVWLRLETGGVVVVLALLPLMPS